MFKNADEKMFNETKSELFSNELYDIHYSTNLGRHLISKKDISPGTIIFKDKAVVYGPFADSQPICLGCYEPLDNTKIRCVKCKIAFICLNCSKLHNPHDSNECKFLHNSKNIDLEKNFSIVTPLRFLLLKQTNPELWNKLILLESHDTVRKELPIWKEIDNSIVKVLSASGLTDDSRLIQKICGILDVNSFAIRRNLIYTYSGEGDIRALFPQASLMSHSCIGNVHLSQTGPFEITVRANTFISNGEVICFNYTNSLKCTEERQEILKNGKYFKCKCERCEDPTELGTYLNSLKCGSCRDGLLIRNLTDLQRWKCSKCDFTCGNYPIQMALLIMNWNFEDAAYIQGTKDLENIIEKYQKRLSPNHWLIIHWTQELIERYMVQINFINTEISFSVEKQIDIHNAIINKCKILLEPLNILEKGISRLKGVILRNLASSMVAVSNMKFDQNKIQAEILMNDLKEGERLLKEAILSLIYESPNSLEGIAFKDGMQTLKNIKNQILHISKNYKHKRLLC